MDGKVLVQAFEPEWLAAHVPRYRETETEREEDDAPLTDDTEEVVERLKSIGYIK